MALKLPRRSFLQMAMGAAGLGAGGLGATAQFAPALAATEDAATIGWPNDVPSWDPNQRFTPDAQPIFKAVFDQPLDQDPALNLVPNLIKNWKLDPDARSMAI